MNVVKTLIIILISLAVGMTVHHAIYCSKIINAISERLSLKDSIIVSYKVQLGLKDSILGNHKKATEAERAINRMLKKDVRTQKTKAGIAYGVIGVLTFLLVK